MSESASLYEQLGGEAAIGAAVGIFYKKVMADPLLSPFFEGVDMERQMKKQQNFLSMAFGGPNNYTGQGMRNAHKKLVEEKGLSDLHFDRVLQHLGDTMKDLNVPEDLMKEAAAIAESTRNDVLNK